MDSKKIDFLIKSATKFYINNYEINECDHYEKFVSSLKSIIYKYVSKFPIEPLHKFVVFFEESGKAVIWIDPYVKNKHIYHTFTDMSLLAAEICKLSKFESFDFSSYQQQQSDNNNHEGKSYHDTIGIGAEDLDNLVNGHFPDVYTSDTINKDLMDEFLFILRNTMYKEKN